MTKKRASRRPAHRRSRRRNSPTTDWTIAFGVLAVAFVGWLAYEKYYDNTIAGTLGA
jgi:hypothetical protein